MANYPKVQSGQWVQPVRRGYKMACCDCGLVHRINFRLHDGKIQLQAYRDNRSTGQKRRHMKTIG
jgi:hypothetical protein